MNRMFSNKKILQLFIPLVIEQFLVYIVGMLDTVMVSNVGEAAVSGVSIVNEVNNLMIMLLSALAGGGAVCVSQYLGNGDDDQSRSAAGQLLMISAVFSTILCVVSITFHVQILNLLYSKVEPAVMQAARTYFWITALSFPFLGIYNSCAALYRSMNKTKVTMYVSLLVNLVNLVGNYIGIMVLHLGVVGVALPTLVSRLVGAVVMYVLANNKQNTLYVSLDSIMKYRPEIISKILKIAVPNSVENGLFQLGKIIVATIVATYGTTQITANGVTGSISTMCYTTESAMQLAAVTVIGTCVGANDYEQAEYYFKKLVLWAWGFAFINNIIIFLAKGPILSLYVLTDETRNIAFTILTMETVAVMALHAPAFVLPCCIRASGDAKYTMVVGVISMFMARCCGAYLFGTVLGLGVIGTRMAMYLDWFVRIIFFTIRYKSKKWMNYRLI